MPSYIKVPVVKGKQGGHQFYIGSISVGMLVHIVRFTDPNLPPKERAQRVVSLPAAKGICAYITENQTLTTSTTSSCRLWARLTLRRLQDTQSLAT